MDAKKIFTEIIASRTDLSYQRFMSSPEYLFSELVCRVEDFNSVRAASAKGLTAKDALGPLGDYLPDIEADRQFVLDDFLRPVDIQQLPDLNGFVRGMLGALTEDRGKDESDYFRPLSIYHGASGAGKTRTAFFNIVGNDLSTYCVSACQFKRVVNSIYRSPDESSDYFKMLCAVEILLVDDLAMCKFTQPLFELFMEVLNHRTCSEMTTYFTMQAHPKEWVNMLLEQGISRLSIDALSRRFDDFAYCVRFKKMEV